jgi:phage shock protein PspC (stress-responsive transcriptional regulator)/heme/copper-type cytochrome/quinol oxidase subunit 2
MKQVININFQGRVVPIEVSAFELLKNYTESLSRYFSNEDGKEEIINDIESRIGELFQERLKNGIACITDDDVNAIIKSMGRPEDFENAEETSSQQSKASQQSSSQQSYQNTNTTFTHKRLYRDENNKIVGGVCSGMGNYFGIDPVIVRIIAVVLFGVVFLPYIILWIAVPSTASIEIGGTRKKLYRDGDDKIVAGVCSGIGNYFGFSPWIPRLIFLIPFLSFVFHWSHFGFEEFPNFLRFSFSPGSLFIYIILWLVIPEAITTAEKLEMKGEKIDMNSIKNSVMEEIKGVKQRAEKFGNEAKAFAAEKGKTVGADIGNVARRSSRSFGDIIVLIVKGFAYFIMGCVGFALVVALFGIAIASVGIFPLKDFVLRDGWQNILAWGTLIFFIAVPVIGVITWIIRRLAKIKSNGRIMRFTFISLWIIGWVCIISLIALVTKDFKASNNLTMQDIQLANPAINKLEITAPDDIISYSYKSKGLHFALFSNITDEDTFFVNNVHFRIVKSNNDSFHVSIIKLADGKNRQDAENLAQQIKYDLTQTDSLLKTPLGIPIYKNNKFRNQHVIITVAVPVGKRIKINQSIWDDRYSEINMNWGNDDWDDYWGNEEHNWTTNVEYIQKIDGLYKLNGEKADDNNDENSDPDDVDDINQKKLDSLEDRQKKQKDSLERELEKQKEKLLKQTHQDASITPIGSPVISSLM